MTGKLSAQQVANRLAPSGIKLVGEWNGMAHLNKFRCSKGHEWEARWQKNLGCMACRIENSRLSRKEVESRLTAKGLKLVGKWKTTSHKYTFACVAAGHIWEAWASDILYQERGCSACLPVLKHTTEEVQARLALRGLRLKGEWQGTNVRQTFVCSNGHEWQGMGYMVVGRGTGCPECTNHSLKLRFTNDDIVSRLEPRGITLLGEWQGIKQRHRFQCKEGHIWESLGATTVTHGKGCPQCNGIDRERVTREEAIRRLNAHNTGISLVGEWYGTAKDNRFRCRLGHEWSTMGKHPVNKGSGCPECARLRKMNQFGRDS